MNIQDYSAKELYANAKAWCIWCRKEQTCTKPHNQYSWCIEGDFPFARPSDYLWKKMNNELKKELEEDTVKK